MADYLIDWETFALPASFLDELGSVIYKSPETIKLIAQPFTDHQLRYPEKHQLNFERDISFMQIVNTALTFDGKHWILIAYDIKEKKLRIYDSDCSSQLILDKRYKLTHDVEALLVHLLKPKNEKLDIHLIDCPQQKVSGVCGLHASFNLICLAMGKAITSDCMRIKDYFTLMDSLQKVTSGNLSLTSFVDMFHCGENKAERTIGTTNIDYQCFICKLNFLTCKVCFQPFHPANAASHCENPKTVVRLTERTEHPSPACERDEHKSASQVLSYNETYKCCGACGHFYHPSCRKPEEKTKDCPIFGAICKECYDIELDRIVERLNTNSPKSNPQLSSIREPDSVEQMQLSNASHLQDNVMQPGSMPLHSSHRQPTNDWDEKWNWE